MDINKPITVARDDFIHTLTTVINDSMLPAFIVEDVLKDFYFETKAVAKKQLESDRLRYEESLSNVEV